MRIKLLIAMTLILIGQICGEIKITTEVKATGKLLIPTASGKKPYKSVIVITQAEIRLECDRKIFQPFNEFDTPKQAKIRVDTAQVDRIWLDGDEIIILPKDPFYRRYRNQFHHIRLVCILCDPNKTAIIFVIDNPADIGNAGQQLIQDIDNRQSRKKHGFTSGYKGYIFNRPPFP